MQCSILREGVIYHSYNPADNSVYYSAKHFSRITRIDFATGQIVYNMGQDMPSGDTTFGDGLFHHQHAPEMLPNGNMLIFDNGNDREPPSEVQPGAGTNFH